MINLGEKIKYLRAEKNLTQKALATAISITIPTLSHWECGYQEPSFEDLSKLADFFEVSSDYLLGRSDDFGNITVQGSSPTLSENEKNLLTIFKGLSHTNQVRLLAYAEGLSGADELKLKV